MTSHPIHSPIYTGTRIHLVDAAISETDLHNLSTKSLFSCKVKNINNT